MSDEPDNEDDEADDAPVGYANPPKAHRFRKGVSGNPKGRPRKAAHPAAPLNGRGLDDLILGEAQRLVKVRDGDRTVKMPAIQAALRSEMHQALKGNTKANAQLVGKVIGAINRREDQIAKTFDVFQEMKAEWPRYRARLESVGQEIPVQIPHPDDMHWNTQHRGIMIIGPSNQGEYDCEQFQLEIKTEVRKRLARIQLAQLDRTARCFYEEEFRWGKILLDAFDGCFPEPALRRQAGFDFFRWTEQTIDRPELLEGIPSFALTRDMLRRKGWPDLSSVGPAELHPAHWNRGPDGDEADFLTFMLVWLNRLETLPCWLDKLV